MTPRARLLAAALFVLSLVPARAPAHDEPPKTIAECQEQADRCALHAACRVQTQQLFVTRPGQNGGAETLFLTNTFDHAGHHLEQVVVDPAQAQRSVSRYDDDGNWLDEETWREGKLSERTTFAYAAQGCVTLITSVYRYEPGSALGRLIAAEQRDGVRTSQTWQDGRRRTKDVFGADGTLSWSFTYEYTAAGDLAQITRRDPAGAIVSRQVHTWRPDRLPDTVTDHGPDGAVTRVTRYAYGFRAEGS